MLVFSKALWLAVESGGNHWKSVSGKDSEGDGNEYESVDRKYELLIKEIKDIGKNSCSVVCEVCL